MSQVELSDADDAEYVSVTEDDASGKASTFTLSPSEPLSECLFARTQYARCANKLFQVYPGLRGRSLDELTILDPGNNVLFLTHPEIEELDIERHDKHGNLVWSKTWNGGITKFKYSDGLLVSSEQRSNKTTYNYDANRRLISAVRLGHTDTYEYDSEGREVRINDYHISYHDGGSLIRVVTDGEDPECIEFKLDSAGRYLWITRDGEMRWEYKHREDGTLCYLRSAWGTTYSDELLNPGELCRIMKGTEVLTLITLKEDQNEKSKPSRRRKKVT